MREKGRIHATFVQRIVTHRLRVGVAGAAPDDDEEERADHLCDERLEEADLVARDLVHADVRQHVRDGHGGVGLSSKDFQSVSRAAISGIADIGLSNYQRAA